MTTEKEAEAPARVYVGDIAPERINCVGQWIAQAHASERVTICTKLRALYEEFQAIAMQAPTMLGEDKAKELTPVIEEILKGMFAAIEGIEDGVHMNNAAFPEFARFVIELAGKDRAFGLPPNELQMATENPCTLRPWVSQPK